LDQGQRVSGARSVLVALQGIQHPQQVEVEGAEIHRLNRKYHETKFQKW
jgi:hypothetical protein